MRERNYTFFSKKSETKRSDRRHDFLAHPNTAWLGTSCHAWPVITAPRAARPARISELGLKRPINTCFTSAHISYIRQSSLLGTSSPPQIYLFHSIQTHRATHQHILSVGFLHPSLASLPVLPGCCCSAMVVAHWRWGRQ